MQFPHMNRAEEQLAQERFRADRNDKFGGIPEFIWISDPVKATHVRIGTATHSIQCDYASVLARLVRTQLVGVDLAFGRDVFYVGYMLRATLSTETLEQLDWLQSMLYQSFAVCVKCGSLSEGHHVILCPTCAAPPTRKRQRRQWFECHRLGCNQDAIFGPVKSVRPYRCVSHQLTSDVVV